ncbi:MAG: DUF4846 domain-containing protein [Saprospiraceae bacterium]
MKISIHLSIFIILLFCNCKQSGGQHTINTKEDVFNDETNIVQRSLLINKEGGNIISRFTPPQEFFRKRLDPNSFQFFLSHYKLLAIDTKVHLYNGVLKSIQSAHAAVLDLDTGNKDLQQCADAIMRLRCDYLYESEKYDDIVFNFTNGFPFEYQKWREGRKVTVKGNKVKWTKKSTPQTKYNDYRNYLNKLFMYAGTLSLSQELYAISLESLSIGNVFIKGGSPGHAVIVMDCAIDNNNDKVFLLAQSYMPAQQMHILKNPNNFALSPWYKLSEINTFIQTPEWRFNKNQLMSF